MDLLRIDEALLAILTTEDLLPISAGLRAISAAALAALGRARLLHMCELARPGQVREGAPDHPVGAVDGAARIAGVAARSVAAVVEIARCTTADADHRRATSMTVADSEAAIEDVDAALAAAEIAPRTKVGAAHRATSSPAGVSEAVEVDSAAATDHRTEMGDGDATDPRDEAVEEADGAATDPRVEAVEDGATIDPQVEAVKDGAAIDPRVEGEGEGVVISVVVDVVDITTAAAADTMMVDAGAAGSEAAAAGVMTGVAADADVTTGMAADVAAEEAVVATASGKKPKKNSVITLHARFMNYLVLHSYLAVRVLDAANASHCSSLPSNCWRILIYGLSECIGIDDIVLYKVLM